MRAIVMLIACATIASCTPSVFLERENVTYNFSDEGFLDPSVLQTIGNATVGEIAPGQIDANRLCNAMALENARARALSIMLHTYFDIPASEAVASFNGADDTFAQDYPMEFTARDLIRAEMAFGHLLDRGFIALQDNRARKSCSLVFRVEGSDLPAEIRDTTLRFRPQRLNEQTGRGPEDRARNRLDSTSTTY